MVVHQAVVVVVAAASSLHCYPKMGFKLLPGTIHLFYTEVDKIIGGSERESLYRSVLNPEEIEKVDRFRFKKDRDLSLTARVLVRYLFSLYYSLPPEIFSFVANSYGKPSLAPGSGPLNGEIIKFNLSHTKGIVVCGLCKDYEIGVDVERLGRNASSEIASRFFSRTETDWITQSSEGEREDRFLNIWTLKEAYIKAKGKGLSIPLDSFSINPKGESIHIKFKDADRREKGWQFFTWRPKPAVQIATAVQAQKPIHIYKYECLPFKWIKQMD
jgi:4'-phosphopantetheinyl transferase